MSRELFDRYYNAAFNDIYVIDECYSCIFMISDHARALNDAGIGHLFGRFQEHLREMMIVAVGRIFDSRSDVYSIPNMVANAGKFPLENQSAFVARLQKLNAGQSLTTLIENEGLSLGAVAGLREIVPTKNNCPKLQRVINMRHKEVAHRDNTASKFDRPIFTDVLDCGVLAKNWIGCFSDGIRGGNFWDANGTTPLFEDTSSAALQMRRIFQLVYAIPAEDNFSISYAIDRNKERLNKQQNSKRGLNDYLPLDNNPIS